MKQFYPPFMSFLGPPAPPEPPIFARFFNLFPAGWHLWGGVGTQGTGGRAREPRAKVWDTIPGYQLAAASGKTTKGEKIINISLLS